MWSITSGTAERFSAGVSSAITSACHGICKVPADHGQPRRTRCLVESARLSPDAACNGNAPQKPAASNRFNSASATVVGIQRHAFISAALGDSAHPRWRHCRCRATPCARSRNDLCRGNSCSANSFSLGASDGVALRSAAQAKRAPGRAHVHMGIAGARWQLQPRLAGLRHEGRRQDGQIGGGCARQRWLPVMRWVPWFARRRARFWQRRQAMPQDADKSRAI